MIDLNFTLRCGAERRAASNVLTIAGLNALRDVIGFHSTSTARSSYAPSHIALGKGSATPAETDTALGDVVAATGKELYARRYALSFGGQAARTGAEFQARYLTSEANGETYSEAGLFDDPAATGNLLARVVFSPVSKTSAAELIINWEWIFT